MRMSRQEAIARVNKAFSGLVGQASTQRILKSSVIKMLMTGDPMPPVLLTGRSGLGKTTFATATADAIGWEFTPVLCGGVNSAEAIEDIIYPLSERQTTEETAVWYAFMNDPVIRETPVAPERAPANKVVFLDELHAMGSRAAKAVEPILDSRTLSMGTAGAGRVTPPFDFAILGASNVERRMDDSLKNRFQVRLKLEEYTLPELFGMAQGAADSTGYALADDGLSALIMPARMTPRILGSLIGRVVDVFAAEGRDPEDSAGRADVQDVLNDLGYLPCGLHKNDMRYLNALHSAEGQAAGIDTLAAILSEDAADLRTEMEPWLLRLKLIEKTPRGRKLTKDGAEFHAAHKGGGAAGASAFTAGG